MSLQWSDLLSWADEWVNKPTIDSQPDVLVLPSLLDLPKGGIGYTQIAQLIAFIPVVANFSGYDERLLFDRYMAIRLTHLGIVYPATHQASH